MRAVLREVWLGIRCLIVDKMLSVACRIMPPAERDEDVYARLAIDIAASDVLSAATRHLELATDLLPRRQGQRQ